MGPESTASYEKIAAAARYLCARRLHTGQDRRSCSAKMICGSSGTRTAQVFLPPPRASCGPGLRLGPVVKEPGVGALQGEGALPVRVLQAASHDHDLTVEVPRLLSGR